MRQFIAAFRIIDTKSLGNDCSCMWCNLVLSFGIFGVCGLEREFKLVFCLICYYFCLKFNVRAFFLCISLSLFLFLCFLFIKKKISLNDFINYEYYFIVCVSFISVLLFNFVFVIFPFSHFQRYTATETDSLVTETKTITHERII